MRYPTFQLFWLPLLGLGLSACVRQHFFQADARIGPAAAAPLPSTADSVRVTAGRHYNVHSGAYKLVLGKHYRRLWATPVMVPVLDLATAAPGGLKGGKIGGGYQSISMTLNGTRDRRYALRALDKEPSKTLPVGLRKTFVLNAVRDATSAANPYGALVVPPLAQAAGVLHTNPRLVYVRLDETRLGQGAERFPGKLALLEEKYEGPANRTPALAAATDLLDGEDMLKKVYASSTYFIDQPAFLRARLLDVWLGDWDRHERQWQWAEFRQANGRVRFQGIPKDRDQVFFRFSDGLLPWLISRSFVAPQFQTFRPKYGNVKGLVKQAVFIDQRGLSHMSRADFQRVAADLQHCWPDTLIERALRRMPPAAYALEGPTLAAALRQRRDQLPQAADQFYRTLARQPVVAGTAQAERFVVRRYTDSTSVVVYAVGQDRRSDSLRFRRTYYLPETREITLEGLAGNDAFQIETISQGAQMPVLVYGGPGTDALQLQGSKRRLAFYDEPASTGPSSLLPRPLKAKHRPYDRLNDDKAVPAIK